MTLAIEPKDLILAIPAFSGMVLGIYNFFNERAKRKIKETLNFFGRHHRCGGDAFEIIL